NWGIRQGRFMKFYLDGLNLELDEVAFANVAWCSTAGNRYPPDMLKLCFAKHTRQLLKGLDPEVVLLSGSQVHSFPLPTQSRNRSHRQSPSRQKTIGRDVSAVCCRAAELENPAVRPNRTCPGFGR